MRTIYPIIIVRKDDKQNFIHLGEGYYRTLWGCLNNSISETPLIAFSKELFDFIYDDQEQNSRKKD